jgi:hypothetical protein
MIPSLSRLRALRRSHCDTCGCSRCQRIDAQLTVRDAVPDGHGGPDDSWLMAGTLVYDEARGWLLRADDSDQPLDEALRPWRNHDVLVMVGRAREGA